MKIKNLFTRISLILVFTVCLSSSFAAEQSGTTLNAHLKQGNLLFCQAKYDDAIAEFEKAVADAPGDVYANTNLAYAYYIMGQYDKAFNQWENVTKISPENGIALDFLVEAYQEKFVDIGGIFVIYYPLNCAVAECRKFVSEIQKQRLNADPNYDNSIRVYENVLRESPNDVIAQHLLAMSYYNKGWRDIAVHYLKASLDVAPMNFSAMYSLAAILDESSSAEAIQLLKNALAVNPEYLKAQYLLSYRLMVSVVNNSKETFKTKSDYVEREFKDMLSSGKASEGVYECLAYIHYMLSLGNVGGKTVYDTNELKKSFDYLEKAFDLRLAKFKKGGLPPKYMLVFPFTVDLRTMRYFTKADMDSKAKGGEPLLEKVRELMNEKVKEGKDSLFLDMMLASLNLADAQYDDAVKNLDGIVKKYPEFKSIYHKTLGDIAYEEGKYEKALESYKQAADDDPDSVIMPARIGQCYLKLNKEKESLPYFIKTYEGEGSGSSSDYVVDDILYTVGSVLKKNNVIPYVKLNELVVKEGNGIPVGSIDNESFCTILNAAEYACKPVYLRRIKKADSSILKSLNKNKVVVAESEYFRNFDAVVRYVENGGTLLLLTAMTPSFDVINSVNYFGISLSSMTFVGGRGIVFSATDNKWLRVVLDSSLPIFKSLDEFYVSNAVEVIPGDATVLAKVGDAPIIVEKKYGKGKIIVAGIGTDFQDAVWKKKDEKIVRSRLKLFLNMVAYLAKD